MDNMQIADMLALGDLTGIDPDLLTEEESAALPKPAGAAGFGENLAERLDEAELLRIGQDVLDGFESDETSRADWRLREKLGMRLLGISENPDKPPAFEGGSTAVFPGLIEAIIQFQARRWRNYGHRKVRQKRYPKACSSAQTLSDKPSGWRNI
jgi:hypothetical protein